MRLLCQEPKAKHAMFMNVHQGLQQCPWSATSSTEQSEDGQNSGKSIKVFCESYHINSVKMRLVSRKGIIVLSPYYNPALLKSQGPHWWVEQQDKFKCWNRGRSWGSLTRCHCIPGHSLIEVSDMCWNDNILDILQPKTCIIKVKFTYLFLTF